MVPKSAEAARSLAATFHDMSVALGNFRFKNWNELSANERVKLQALQWELMQNSSDLTADAMGRTIDELGDSLAEISNVTTTMKSALNTIQSVDKALSIAAAAVSVGTAVMSGNLMGIGKAVKDGYDAVKS